MKCALPGSAKYNFEATEAREPFEDPNFGLITVRTSFVYRFCSTRHLRNIREIFNVTFPKILAKVKRVEISATKRMVV